MLKMRLITALAALMFSFGMMDTAHAAPQADLPALISVKESMDSLEIPPTKNTQPRCWLQPKSL